MKVLKMSHHSRGVRAPALYLACLTTGVGPRLLLEVVAEAVLKGRVFMPSQAKLGELLHRDRRTIIRWAKAASAKGWLRVVRRGKKLTNLYLLSRALWRRLTGQVRGRVEPGVQLVMDRLWKRIRENQGAVLAQGRTG